MLRISTASSLVNRIAKSAGNELDEAEQADLWALAGRVRAELSDSERPDGFNVGLNDRRRGRPWRTRTFT